LRLRTRVSLPEPSPGQAYSALHALVNCQAANLVSGRLLRRQRPVSMRDATNACIGVVGWRLRWTTLFEAWLLIR
jgi:hypothetical protein